MLKHLSFPSAGLAVVAVLLAGIGVYAFGLAGDFFFDDIPNILQNKALDIPRLSVPYLLEAAFSFETASFGRPLSMVSFAIDWFLFGPDPFYFKLTNVVLHAASGVLVYVFVRELLRLRDTLQGSEAQSASFASAVAFWTALLWVTSPVHANTVLYVVQRMTVLSGFLSLIALVAYLQLRRQLYGGQHRRALVSAALFLTAAGLAVLSKETALLLPLYLLVVEAFILKLRGLGPLRPVFVVGIGSGVLLPAVGLAALILASPGWLADTYSIRDFTPGERVLTQARVLLLYLRNVVLPSPADIRFFFDDFEVSRSLTMPFSTLLSIGGLAILCAAAWATRNRWPLAAFGLFWFLAGHALESSFLSLENVYFHRNYLPSVGPLCLLAAFFVALSQGSPSKSGSTRMSAGTAGLVVLVALFMVDTATVAQAWGDRRTLATTELAKSPDSSRANYFYSRAVIAAYQAEPDESLLKEARSHLLKSAELDRSSILPLAALGYLEVALKHPIDIDYFGEISERLRNGRLLNENVGALRVLAQLQVKNPERIDFFSVLALFEAARENRGLGPAQKAGWLVAEAEFLRDAGMADAFYLDSLRRAVCLNPKSRFMRITLLQALLQTGALGEARSLANTGFTRWELLIDPRVRYYRGILDTSAPLL